MKQIIFLISMMGLTSELYAAGVPCSTCQATYASCLAKVDDVEVACLQKCAIGDEGKACRDACYAEAAKKTEACWNAWQLCKKNCLAPINPSSSAGQQMVP